MMRRSLVGGGGVVILEYGDDQCPYSRRACRNIEELQAQDSSLRFVFRHLPLTEVHPHALAAAGFAEAAAAQGLFSATHELLFVRQKALGDDDLFGHAARSFPGPTRLARLRDDLDRDELWQRVREDADLRARGRRERDAATSSTAGSHTGGYHRSTLRATLDSLEAT